jgi:hypothetical protein
MQPPGELADCRLLVTALGALDKHQEQVPLRRQPLGPGSSFGSTLEGTQSNPEIRNPLDLRDRRRLDLRARHRVTISRSDPE